MLLHGGPVETVYGWRVTGAAWGVGVGPVVGGVGLRVGVEEGCEAVHFIFFLLIIIFFSAVWICDMC